MDDLIKRSDVLALLPETDIVGYKPSALRKKVSALPAADAERWISVDERLPEHNDKYIVATAKGAVFADHWYGYRWGHTILEITHWRPFPEAPKEA